MQQRPYRAPPPTESISDSFGYWLAGLIDGEGSFAIERHHPRPGRKATTYSCRFALMLRADDRPALLSIVNETGIGSLHFMHTPTIRARGARPSCCWIMHRRADCAALVALLDRYPLRTKKARDFGVWREAVAYWLIRRTGHGRHGVGGSWAPMEHLRRRLTAVRKFEMVE